jgi:predicted  nucleic acid-binding Zn-ribbon protein
MGLLHLRRPASKPSDAAPIPGSHPDFKPAGPAPGRKDSDAIDLVCQASEIMRDIKASAAATLERAQQLAERAVERLASAQARILALETAQSTTEADLHEAVGRADQMELLARRTGAQLLEREDQLADAENRATKAEERAAELEGILAQLEEAIQMKLLAERPRQPNKAARAAA